MVEEGLTKIGERVDEKVDNTSINNTLTEIEREVLHFLTNEFLTIREITQRRKCSRQAVHKIIKSLKKKGAFDIGLTRVDKSRGTPSLIYKAFDEKIRLHGEEFNIRLLSQSRHYNNLLENSNKFILDGNTIKLYKRSLEIYSDQSFFGRNAQEATSKSVQYWKHFLARLEHELNIILVKPRARNIKLVNSHYAYTGSEISEKAIEEGKQIKIFAVEDGKLAFITDDSFGFKEDETVHPITAKPDREAIDKQVNDWRINNPPTNSELAIIIKQDMQNLGNYIQYLGAHVESVKQLGSGVQELVSLIKQLKGGDK